MKNQTLTKVLIAILLAAIAGFLTGPEAELFGIKIVRIYGLIGQLFLNALTLVVVPLVASSIITGTARMGSEKSFGKLGTRTFAAFIGTSLIAVLIGYLVVQVIGPGISQKPILVQGVPEQFAALAQHVNRDGFDTFAEILYKLIPSNILAVASQGQMLGLIAFSLLFGFFIHRIESEPGQTMLQFWRGIFQIMMRMTEFVMRALPIGVFGLVAKVIAVTGVDALTSIAKFFISALIAFAIYMGVVMPLILRTYFGVSPMAHFRAMSPALFTAFSTSSSAVTLPVTIECIEERVGISNRICSFTIPLGASLNLSGSAMYSCLVVLFLSQVYGVALSIPTQCMVILLSLLTSIGLAGIPSAVLISVLVILNTVGLPAEALGLILPIERFLDMFRTVVNVYGQTGCCVMVARLEGENTAIAR